MTTDRPAAPPRSTALLQPSSNGSRTSSTPSDTFSTLLGAATPRTESQQPSRASRRDDDDRRATRPREDDDRQSQRADHRDDDRRPDKPRASDDASRPADPPADASQPAAPVADTPKTPADQPPAPAFQTNLAAQLASPLPPTVAAGTPAPAADPTKADPKKLPVFAPAGLVAASAVAAQAAATPVQAQTPAPAAATPADPATVPTVPTLPVVGKPDQQPGQGAKQQPGGQAQQDASPPQAALPQPAPSAPDATAAATTPVAAPQATPDQPAQKPSEPTAIKVDAPAAPTPAAPATPQVVPPVAPPVAPAAAAALERAVPMGRVVESSALMLKVTAEKGVTHARLNLKPAELGGVEVRLRHSPDGVSAHLVADSPEAAKMLSQAAHDLRRQLEASDVNLLSLDVSTSGDQQQFAQAQGGSFEGFFGENSSTNSSRGLNRTASTADAVEVESPSETTLALPNGVLVDVLA